MSKFTPDELADLKGLSCPMPILKTKKALQGMESGKILQIDLTDVGSKADIPAMLKKSGDELLEMTEEGNVITFFIKKK